LTERTTKAVLPSGVGRRGIAIAMHRWRHGSL
jgi:hypothetical protein